MLSLTTPAFILIALVVFIIGLVAGMSAVFLLKSFLEK